MSRVIERAKFTHPVRLQLLEKDQDDLETALETVNDRLGKILWAVVGVLISVSTSAILLALNLGVTR